MKNQIKLVALAAALALQATQTFAGLDWTYGSLSNPDNLVRSSRAVAYSTSGNVFVTGVVENTAGNKLIVTKKFSSAGILLATATNSYAVIAGTIVNDYSTGITLDGAGNVYVLGSQYGSSSRANDIVLIKYNSSLTQQWKKLIYNSNSTVNNYNDTPSKLLTDAGNNVYVTGTWSKVSFFGTEEIFVRKYSASGTILFTTSVPQGAGTTIYDASDMCLDNSSNITVCAKAGSTLATQTILYARISSTGSLSWKKFYSPPVNYTFIGKPEAECTTAGTLYLLSSLNRRPTSADNYGRLLTIKLNISGTMQWEQLTPEVHEYTDEAKLRLDAANNIYTGSDFSGPHSGGYLNHRIYKLNSSGTLLWSYTSAETSVRFSFETFSSSAVFALFERTSNGVNPILRKLDAANGNIIWSETLSYTPPPGYHHSQISLTAIAVNTATSEVAFCGEIEADDFNGLEWRWIIKKYGATVPRLSPEETITENAPGETKIQLYPNPVSDFINVSWNINLPDAKIRVMDVNGKIVKQMLMENNSLQQTIPVDDLSNGIYFVQVESSLSDRSLMRSQKIIIQH